MGSEMCIRDSSIPLNGVLVSDDDEVAPDGG
mgnify:CR=1 FL=1